MYWSMSAKPFFLKKRNSQWEVIHKVQVALCWQGVGVAEQTLVDFGTTQISSDS